MRTRHISRSLLWLGAAVAVLLGVLLIVVMRQAHASGTPLLPNLVADPPDQIGLAEDTSTGTPRLLLRFNGYIHNKGPGALDFRGRREAPKVSKAVEEEVEHAREKEQGLPQKTEEELAKPPMTVVQRLFTTNPGEEETNIERPHKDEPSNAQIIYSSADGHHHWHLQRAAKYSLWNQARTAEAAPAQKVGFCLDDSKEQHVEPKVGPTTQVYADNVPPYRDFCQQYRPNATSLFEGVSPGWRDLYSRELAFQWVDASNVLPGKYWLREDVNPLGQIQETGSEKKSGYATEETTIPGFDAQPQSLGRNTGEARTITLTYQRFQANGKPSGGPRFAIASPPLHGSLDQSKIKEGKVTYTPEAGYFGADSFTFSAVDPNSTFPTTPAVATVSVEGAEAHVSIGTAPTTMTVGTSSPLTAMLTYDSHGVEWIASAGHVTPGGSEGLTATYTAPSEVPPGGTVTVTARLTDNHAVSEQRTIKIVPESHEPAPEAGGASTSTASTETAATATPTAGTQGFTTTAPLPKLTRPNALLLGRRLIMTTLANVAGRIRLSAYLGHRRLGTCAVLTPGGRSFTCRLTLPSNVRLNAHISVLASLRVGTTIIQVLRPAAPVPLMKMKGTTAHGQAASVAAAQFWCSPSMVESLPQRSG
jgi:hypothetical protein